MTSTSSVNKGSGLKSNDSSLDLTNSSNILNMCSSSNSSKSAFNILDLQKLKSFKDSCADYVNKTSDFIKSKTSSSKQKPSYEKSINNFVKVSTCVVPSSSNAFKKFDKNININNLIAKSKAKNQRTSGKMLNKVKLDSKGRPISRSSVNLHASNKPRTSVLLERLTDSLRNIKLMSNGKNRSPKKQKIVKMDRHGKSKSKIVSFSSEQPKSSSNKSDPKRHQNNQVSSATENMLDSYINKNHSMVSFFGKTHGNSCYVKINEPISSLPKIRDEVNESIYDVPQRLLKEDNVYDVPQKLHQRENAYDVPNKFLEEENVYDVPQRLHK